MTLTKDDLEVIGQRRRTTPVERRITPIKWFGGAGAFFLTVQLYAYGRWVLSGNFKRTPVGPDEVPAYMKTAIIIHEIAFPILCALCVYFYAYRPWRRKQPVPLAGYLIPACLAMYWQDVASNYFNHFFTLNSYAINFGAWYNFIPGWASPRANHLAEGFVIWLPSYVVGIIPPAIFTAWVMRKAKARWPSLGSFGLLTIAFWMFALFDLLIEVPWVTLGLYIFAGTIPELTLFSGHYYQFPIYESFAASAFFFTPFAALFYFRDDRGITFVERGLTDLRLSRRTKSALKAVAFVGFANLAFVAYNVFLAILTLMPGFQWADDVVRDRSYFRNEVCGAGTTYACPADDIPIPKRGGRHVSPEGGLVEP